MDNPTPASHTPASKKTVADIWQEVQSEQKRFNQIVKILVGLLIVAAAIAVTAAVVSFFEFRNLQKEYDMAIAEARASAKVSAGEATRERQRMRSQLLTIQEDSQAQREQADLIRRVDRALALSRAAARPETIGSLVDDAIIEARKHVLGVRLNLATSHLVNSVLESPSAELSDDQRLLLDAVRVDWERPRDSEEVIRALMTTARERSYRGLGAAALAQHIYTNADSDNLGEDAACDQVMQLVDDARTLGVSAMGPYLWKGECLRKRGQEAESFSAFIRALELQDQIGATRDNRRIAAHGAGTTLIARAAAAGGALPPEEAGATLAALTPIMQTMPELSDTVGTNDPLVAAKSLLRHAADIRVQRGEGDVGEYYTTENIGFIYVLQKDWTGGLTHSREIDEVIPLAWNLTVRYISATELAEETSNRTFAAQLREEAASAAQTLSLMRYQQFDESELRKLLPSSYSETVETLIEDPRRRHYGVSDDAELVNDADE